MLVAWPRLAEGVNKVAESGEKGDWFAERNVVDDDDDDDNDERFLNVGNVPNLELSSPRSI